MLLTVEEFKAISITCRFRDEQLNPKKSYEQISICQGEFECNMLNCPVLNMIRGIEKLKSKKPSDPKPKVKATKKTTKKKTK